MNNIGISRLSWRERLFRSAFPYLVCDAIAVVVAYYVTLFLRFYNPYGKQVFTWINITFNVRNNADVGDYLANFYISNAPHIQLILIVTLTFLYTYLDYYARRRFIRRRQNIRIVATANLIALGAFYGYFYLTRNEFHPRSVFATLLAINVILTILGRRIMTPLLNQSPAATCRVLLVGQGPEAEFIARFIAITRSEGLEIVAQLPTTVPLSSDRFMASISSLVEEHRTHLILCAEKSLNVAQIMQLLEIAESLDQEVKILSDKLNVLVNEAGIPSDYFMEFPLVHFAFSPANSPTKRMRTFFFRLLAGLLLLFILPIMLIIAGLIKLTSPGPAFFVQDRIGINRIPFRMYKFRTMHERAEELQAQIEKFNESGEGLFKIKHDPRVTTTGRFLRRFSLDELPQLFNVVRGEMTVVGPRPLPRRDYENYYEEWHYSRHSGLPGLTCLWQVSGRSDISFHNMCILDDYYLRNQNIMLDLKIIQRTIGVVLFAKGAY